MTMNITNIMILVEYKELLLSFLDLFFSLRIYMEFTLLIQQQLIDRERILLDIKN